MTQPTEAARPRSWLMTAAAAVLAIGLAHCSSSVEQEDDGAGGNTSSTTSSTSSTTSSSTTSDGGSGGTTECGDDVCGSDEFCDYSYDYCSNDSPDPGFCDEIPSECAPRPTSCTADDGPPVCGCDGSVYESACHASAQGIDVGADLCETTAGPAGTFGCGSLFCDGSTSFCDHGIGDTCDHYFACVPLPPECQPPAQADCSCFALGSSTECTMVQGNGVQGVRLDSILI